MSCTRETLNGTQVTFSDRLAWILFCCIVVSFGLVQTRISVGPLELGLTEVLFLLLLPLWLYRFLTNGPRLPAPPLLLATGIYILTGLLSAITSNSRQSSLKHLLGETYLLLLLFVSADLIDRVVRLRAISIAWILGTAISSLVALLTIAIFYFDPQNQILPYLTYHHGSVPAGNFPRVTATFASASLFFNYASGGIILLLCSQRVQLLPQSVSRLLLAATLIAAIFTFSIGLGCLFLVAAFWVLLKDRRISKLEATSIWIFVFVSLTFLILALVALEAYPEAPFNFALSGTGFRIYPSARYLIWSDSIQTIRNNFFLGVGPGNPVCNVIFTNTDKTMSLLTDAHNTFLNVLAERGVFGGVAFIITLALIIRPRSLSGIRSPESPAHLLSLGLRFALMLAFVYQGLVGSFEDAKHLWVLMGIAIAAEQVRDSPDTRGKTNEIIPI